MTTAPITTAPHPDAPLPAEVEVYDEWRTSPIGVHYRKFATKPFPVFDWLTVETGGIQFVDGAEFIVRNVRVVGAEWLLGSQARMLAQTLTGAADYVADLEAREKAGLSDPLRR
jgi:hypothetical protein